MHRSWGARADANTITPMAEAAMFKSIVCVPDLVVPGGREAAMRPAPGEGDTVWRFSDDPHRMLTAKDGAELQPRSSKHTRRGYFRARSACRERGCGGRGGIIKLSCCLSALRGEGKEIWKQTNRSSEDFLSVNLSNIGMNGYHHLKTVSLSWISFEEVQPCPALRFHSALRLRASVAIRLSKLKGFLLIVSLLYCSAGFIKSTRELESVSEWGIRACDSEKKQFFES